LLLEQTSPALYLAAEVLVTPWLDAACERDDFAAEVLVTPWLDAACERDDFAAEVLVTPWLDAACERDDLTLDVLLEPHAAAPSVRARDAPSTGITRETSSTSSY